MMGTSIPGGLGFRHTSVRVRRESSRWSETDTKWRADSRETVGHTNCIVVNINLNIAAISLEKAKKIQQTNTKLIQFKL